MKRILPALIPAAILCVVMTVVLATGMFDKQKAAVKRQQQAAHKIVWNERFVIVEKQMLKDDHYSLAVLYILRDTKTNACFVLADGHAEVSLTPAAPDMCR